MLPIFKQYINDFDEDKYNEEPIDIRYLCKMNDLAYGIHKHYKFTKLKEYKKHIPISPICDIIDDTSDKIIFKYNVHQDIIEDIEKIINTSQHVIIRYKETNEISKLRISTILTRWDLNYEKEDTTFACIIPEFDEYLCDIIGFEVSVYCIRQMDIIKILMNEISQLQHKKRK
jgi:hypothetical protein